LKLTTVQIVVEYGLTAENLTKLLNDLHCMSRTQIMKIMLTFKDIQLTRDISTRRKKDYWENCLTSKK
jgi:hypothetical protein